MMQDEPSKARDPARRRRPTTSTQTFEVHHRCTAVCLVVVIFAGGLTGCATTGGGGAGGEPTAGRAATARREGFKDINITAVRRELEFNARYREQNQKSKVGRGALSTEEMLFEESVRLEVEGSVYHPNLFEFTLSGLFGLLQQDFDETFDDRRRTSSDDGDIYEFEFEGLFLKKKKYPLSAYARRYRILEPRAFLSSLQTTTSTYGFTWQYVDEKMPTSLQLNYTEVEIDPLDPEEGEGLQENFSVRFDTQYRFSDRNILTFIYEHEDVREEPFELDFKSDEFRLEHDLIFGERGRHRLESEISYFDQRGTFDIQRFRWREILRLQHTDDLKSWYQLEYLDRDQGSLSGVEPIGEEQWYFAGTLEHQLYESLYTQLFAFYQTQRFDSGLDIDRMGFQPSFDYRKKNPWGELQADYTFRIQKEERDGGGLSGEVLDERQTFMDPEPARLSNPNVSVASIFVTAEDRITVYRAGDDFIVRRVGDFIELERIPTGNILEGETVLVDYVFLVPGDFDLDTERHLFGIRQRFNFGLTPYYRFRKQNQDISPKDARGITPDDIEAHVGGAEWDIGPLRLTAEYEDQESLINPFTAVRATADYTHRFEFGGVGRIRARWSDVDRRGDQDRQTEFWTVEGRYRQRVGTTFAIETSVLYREEDDSESGNDSGVDLDVTVEWNVRQTEVRVTYEYGRFDDDFSENDNQSLFVQLRRQF